jgi:hypothetical protein
MTNRKQAANPEPRLRFVAAETRRARGSHAEVKVTLALPSSDPEAESERLFTVEARGEAAELLEARLAVQATLEAIAEATGRTDYFKLVGLRVVPAFDTRIVLVCVRTLEEPSIQVVGAVPVATDIVRTAATATLDATNRIVARMLNEEE